METDRELTNFNEQPFQETRDAPMSIRFLGTEEITSQELELVMAALDGIVAEMQRLELADLSA